MSRPLVPCLRYPGASHVFNSSKHKHCCGSKGAVVGKNIPAVPAPSSVANIPVRHKDVPTTARWDATEGLWVEDHNVTFNVEDGVTMVERNIKYYNSEGRLHRDGKPAMLVYRDGLLVRQRFYLNGYAASFDGEPADVRYAPDGTVIEQAWYVDGGRHRDGGKPAQVYYYPDGTLREESYFYQGRLSAPDEETPTLVQYNPDGSVHIKRWTHNLGTEDPYSIMYSGGKVKHIEWRSYGSRGYGPELHRNNGPAVIRYRDDGTIEYRRYVRNGQGPTEGQFNKANRIAEEYDMDRDDAMQWVFAGFPVPTIRKYLNAEVTFEEALEADAKAKDNDHLKEYIAARSTGIPHEWALTMAQG